MASQGYADWIRAGKPYRLITPCRDLQDTLTSHGLTVFDYPDESHLKANVPEDHTPYSVTGWPAGNARWNARGLDIMPRDGSAAARKENADIARQLIRDRDAGHPGAVWIKYVNWTDEQGNCYHVAWQPSKKTTASNDDGHVHVSGRSDVDTYAAAAGYDPIARMNGDSIMAVDSQRMINTDQTLYAIGQLDLAAVGVLIQGRTTQPLPLVALLNRLDTAAAADATRDAAMVAAIQALTAAGGSPDSAAIIAVVREEADKTRDLVEQLQEENAALRARLAAAYGPGSE